MAAQDAHRFHWIECLDEEQSLKPYYYNTVTQVGYSCHTSKPVSLLNCFTAWWRCLSFRFHSWIISNVLSESFASSWLHHITSPKHTPLSYYWLLTMIITRLDYDNHYNHYHPLIQWNNPTTSFLSHLLLLFVIPPPTDHRLAYALRVSVLLCCQQQTPRLYLDYTRLGSLGLWWRMLSELDLHYLLPHYKLLRVLHVNEWRNEWSSKTFHHLIIWTI